MPTEEEMRPKDKYTMFDRKEKSYRKGVHSEFDGHFLLLDERKGFWLTRGNTELPKWTKVSQRINPPGF